MMPSIVYDASCKSLFHPGEADNFFQLGLIQDDAALCAEMSRLAYVTDEIRLQGYLGRIGFKPMLTMGYGKEGTQFFVAGKQDERLTIVAFRGSEPDDPADWFAEVNVALMSWTDGSGRALG